MRLSIQRLITAKANRRLGSGQTSYMRNAQVEMCISKNTCGIFMLALGLLSCSDEMRTTSEDRVMSDLSMIYFKIESFHQGAGRWPATPEDFESILEGMPKMDPWGNLYQVKVLEEGGYLLRSSGIDGIMGNADDISLEKYLQPTK